jgi:hypothetical protein
MAIVSCSIVDSGSLCASGISISSGASASCVMISWAPSPLAGEVIFWSPSGSFSSLLRASSSCAKTQVVVPGCSDLEHPASCTALMLWGRDQEFLILAWVVLWLFVGVVVPMSLGGRDGSSLRLLSDVDWS